jgi:hypothetical protein
MKKIVLIMLMLMICSIMVMAQNNDNKPVPELTDAGHGSEMDDKGSNMSNEGMATGSNMSDHGQGESQKTDEQHQEKNQGEDTQIQNKVENQVREAVHALLAMKEQLGGIGPQVSEVAMNFNNSINAAYQNEEKIQKRSAFSRFFMGGDKKAAREMLAETEQTQSKIQELQGLMGQCNCSDETKAMMQEQIQSMVQEQDRLQQKAQDELKSNGLFGWLFNK